MTSTRAIAKLSDVFPEVPAAGVRSRRSFKATMSADNIKCVLVADRHHGVAEGVRGLLETVFQAVVMVADETSLMESAIRLQPNLAIVDLSLARGNNLEWLRRLRSRLPELKILVLSVHDEPTIRHASMEAGADGFVLKRTLATDLLPTIDSVLAGTHCVPRAGANTVDSIPI